MLAPTATRSNAKTQSPVPSAAKTFYASLVALRPEIYGRALRMARTSDVAEDLVQDTIERALRFAHTSTSATPTSARGSSRSSSASSSRAAAAPAAPASPRPCSGPIPAPGRSPTCAPR